MSGGSKSLRLLGSVWVASYGVFNTAESTAESSGVVVCSVAPLRTRSVGVKGTPIGGETRIIFCSSP